MSRQLRIWRAVAAAFLATGIAALFHLGAHGMASVLAIAVCFLLTTWISVLLAGRRLGLISLAAIVASAQFALHHLMTLFSHAPLNISLGGAPAGMPSAVGAGALGSSAAAGLSGAAAGGGHAHHLSDAQIAAIVAEHSAAGAHLGHAGASTAAGDITIAGITASGMVIAHILSALLTLAVLTCGETFVFALIRAAIGPLATAFTRFVPLALPARIPALGAPLRQHITAAVLGACFRRGPPAVSFTQLRACAPA